MTPRENAIARLKLFRDWGVNLEIKLNSTTEELEEELFRLDLLTADYENDIYISLSGSSLGGHAAEPDSLKAKFCEILKNSSGSSYTPTWRSLTSAIFRDLTNQETLTEIEWIANEVSELDPDLSEKLINLYAYFEKENQKNNEKT